MTGAIEFLQKAKAICKSKETCYKCEIKEMCGVSEFITDEADLVRKVMDYRLEDGERQKNSYYT